MFNNIIYKLETNSYKIHVFAKCFLKVILLSCLPILLLSACSDSKNKPEENPHPKYFVTISGHIDQDMQKPIYLGFWAKYAGFNHDCRVWINRFEGIHGQPGKVDFYPAKPNAKGDYEVKIPIDRYLPGRCDWKIGRIEYSYSNNVLPRNVGDAGRLGSLMAFGSRYSANELPGIADSYGEMHSCDKGENFCTGDGLLAGYTNIIRRNKNYHFTYNFTK